MRSIQFGIVFPTLICAAALFLAAPPSARAAGTPVFLPSDSVITMTHIDDGAALSPNTSSATVAGGSIPSSSPGSFQLVHTFTDGTSNTLADGGAFQTTSSTAMSLGLKTGTGVTQTNPASLYEGPSELNVNADLFWQIPAGGFPAPGHFPGISYSFNVGGVVGAGGEDDFIMNMSFYDVVGATSTFVGSAGIDAGFATQGAFTHLFTSSVLLNNGVPLPAGSTLELVGIISFSALDPLAPSSINLIDDGNLSAVDIPPQQNAVPLPAAWQMSAACLGLCGLLTFKKRNTTTV